MGLCSFFGSQEGSFIDVQEEILLHSYSQTARQQAVDPFANLVAARPTPPGSAVIKAVKEGVLFIVN